MDMSNANLSDMSVGAVAGRDIHSTLNAVHSEQGAIVLLLTSMDARLARLERSRVAERHMMLLNAIVSTLLFSSAVIRHRTGVRRVVV